MRCTSTSTAAAVGEAGRVLGGRPRAFQKYELGKVPVSGPLKNLLVLLDNDPKRLRELRTKLQCPRGAQEGNQCSDCDVTT